MYVCVVQMAVKFSRFSLSRNERGWKLLKEEHFSWKTIRHLFLLVRKELFDDASVLGIFESHKYRVTESPRFPVDVEHVKI